MGRKRPKEGLYKVPMTEFFIKTMNDNVLMYFSERAFRNFIVELLSAAECLNICERRGK